MKKVLVKNDMIHLAVDNLPSLLFARGEVIWRNRRKKADEEG